MWFVRPAFKTRFPFGSRGKIKVGLRRSTACCRVRPKSGTAGDFQTFGATQEIQRLVGRALRAVVDLGAMKDISICIDCDVIQADGGTRTASITGGYVALVLALEKLQREGKLLVNPLKEAVAAVSCALYNGEPVLDVDYIEDSNAQADMNFVLTESGKIVEIQGTAEGAPFDDEQFGAMYALAKKGIAELVEKQKQALGKK